MIIYFADRQMNILDLASTSLPQGFRCGEDTKTEDIDSGVSSFECTVYYTKETRDQVKACIQSGNYILRKHKGDDDEFYTIIEDEENVKDMCFYLYAEDAGLDLLNEVVGPYSAPYAQPIDFYIKMFARDSGFEIGINEIPNMTRRLEWDNESSATERLRSIASQFDGAELSYSFEIQNLEVAKKLINIYIKRGTDTDVQLRQNYEVDNIKVKTSIANLATGLIVTGGTPKDEKKPITLNGYHYDDGDFYTYQNRLYSRSALAKWSRYVWNNEPYTIANGRGHIIKRYTYDTLNQQRLCEHAIMELKKRREPEINYEMDVLKWPENVKLGDRVTVIDDHAGFYVSSRVLKMETSVADATKTVTLGEHIIKSAGIADEIIEMVEDFANRIVINGKDGVDASLLRIDSDSGTIFKPETEFMDLSVSIYKGSIVVSKIGELRQAYGDTARLEWYVKTVGVYEPLDPQRLTHDGFGLRIRNDEFEERISFKCDLMVDDAVVASDQISFGKLEDPIEVFLSMNSVTFQGTETAAIENTVPVKVTAFKGKKQLPCKVVPTELSKNKGITATTDDNPLEPTLTIKASTELTEGGSLLIPVHVDNGVDVVINKLFNYSIAFKGEDGVIGEDAVVISITSSNGLMFKGEGVETLLTAHVFKGGRELTEPQIAELGTITWFDDNGATIGTGVTYSVREIITEAKTYSVVLGEMANAEVTLVKVVDLKNIYRFYALRPDTEVPPKAPKMFPPMESDVWKDTEPPYDPQTGAHMCLYVIDCNEYSDGSYVYTPVSLSTSYEAAKHADGKAEESLEMALSVKQDTNKLQLDFVDIKNTVNQQSRYIRFENGNMIVGETGINGQVNFSAVHTSNSLEFKQGDTTVGKFTSDGLETRNATLFGQWSIRRGNSNGFDEYNLNHVWIK